MKLIRLFILFSFLFLSSAGVVFAKESTNNVEKVDSYVLFWPVVAGKTKADSFYSLKLFKEKIRGLIIFGKPQKADHALFLATKRVLEAEKLIKEEKKDYALETLDMALVQLNIVENNMLQSSDTFQSAVNELNNKFNNLEAFLPWLASQYKDQDFSTKVQKILDMVIKLHGKI